MTNLNQISFNAYAKVTFENYKELEEGGLADQDFREIKNLYEIERKKWMFIAGDSMQGQLNKTQFYSFIYSDEYPHVHEFELRIMFNQFDVNSDGALDVNEFTEGVQSKTCIFLYLTRRFLLLVFTLTILINPESKVGNVT